MNTLRSDRLTYIGALLFFGASLPAFACEENDWTDYCPLGTASIVMSSPDDDGGTQCDVLCDDGNSFPVPRIDCIRGGKEDNSYSCEIWPRGEGLVYEWSSNGLTKFSINGKTELAEQQIFCPRTSLVATVFLRVDTPAGESTSASFLLSCGKYSELYLQGKELPVDP